MTPKKVVWRFVIFTAIMLVAVIATWNLQLGGPTTLGMTAEAETEGSATAVDTAEQSPASLNGLVFEPISNEPSSSATTPLNKRMYVIGDTVRERGTPSTDGSVLKTWQAGEAVQVVGEKNGWYLLDDGGYVRADLLVESLDQVVAHVREQHPDLIVVSKSTQKVEYWIYDRLVASGDCVTGDVLKGHDTPIGLYWVTSREVGKTLYGEDGTPFPTDWYMGLSIGDSYGLHNAPWRIEEWMFGGSNYKGSGSRGCINCPDDLALRIYAECRVGLTYVLILP